MLLVIYKMKSCLSAQSWRMHYHVSPQMILYTQTCPTHIFKTINPVRHQPHNTGFVRSSRVQSSTAEQGTPNSAAGHSGRPPALGYRIFEVCAPSGQDPGSCCFGDLGWWLGAHWVAGPRPLPKCTRPSPRPTEAPSWESEAVRCHLLGNMHQN